MASLRRDIASGLVVVAPIAVVLVALQYVFRLIAGLPIVGAIEPVYLRVPIVLLVFAIVVSAVGYAMRTALGSFLADMIRAAINHIPVLRVVYNASHLAIETAVTTSEHGVEPVKLESWTGLRVTAFDTGKRTDDGRVVCFFPTAPNITTGYVIEVDESDLTRPDEGIERALIRILSAGFGERSAFAREDDLPISGARTVRRVQNVKIADGEYPGHS